MDRRQHPFPTKLTAEQAQEVRRLRDRGQALAEIAGRFGIAKSSVSAIVRYHAHVPDGVLRIALPEFERALLAEIAEDLVRAVLRSHREERTLSLLAISVSHLEEQPAVQLELPLGLADQARRPGAKEGMARLRADRTVDAIRGRFGWESVGYASVALETRRSVPDAFRKLAEREL